MADAQTPTIAETTARVTQSVSDTAASVASGVSSAVSGSAESVKEFSGKYGITVFISIVIAALIFFVAYLLYTYISSVISNKILWIVPETKVPALGNIYTRASGDGIPTSLNGRRMSFSFWVYIHDINKYQGSYRHILHRGDENPVGASPMVMLDKTLNKLYIRFGSLDSNDTTATKKWDEIIYESKKSIATACAATLCTAGELAAINAVSDEDALLKDMATHGIIVDYVPLQRWVHISVIVNETVNRGNMYLYMDGELVKSISSSEKITLSNATTVQYSFQNLQLAKKGDIWLGGNAAGAINVGFAGLVGKVGFTNYDMNAREVYKEYLKGPMDNLTSKLGLPAYGLRSPIYRVG